VRRTCRHCCAILGPSGHSGPRAEDDHDDQDPARAGFNAAQDRRARASQGHYRPRYATPDRLDPYNSARVAAWEVSAYPHAWPVTWLCKGVYDPRTRRLR